MFSIIILIKYNTKNNDSLLCDTSLQYLTEIYIEQYDGNIEKN